MTSFDGHFGIYKSLPTVAKVATKLESFKSDPSLNKSSSQTTFLGEPLTI